jgi:hypothetical protein
MHRGCVFTPTIACSTDTGTFVINVNGTWASCPSGNLGAGACPSGGRNGTLDPLGNGRTCC